MTTWDEADHPRDRRGRFADKADWARAIDGQITGHRAVDGDDLVNEPGRVDWDRLAPLVPGQVRTDGPDPDLALGEILALQGFDGPPRVVSAAEMDRLVSDGGHIELWRGVGSGGGGGDDDHNRSKVEKARQSAEQFRTGPLWPGRGIYGNGTYAGMRRRDGQYYSAFDRDAYRRASAGVTTDEELDEIHDRLEMWPGLLRIALPADANIVDRAQVEDYLRAERRSNERRLAGQRWDARNSDPRDRVTRDLGRLAALLGWDAIRVPQDGQRGDYFVLLNRTKLTVQEAG